MVCEVVCDDVYGEIVVVVGFVKFYVWIVVGVNRVCEELKDDMVVEGDVVDLVVGE